MTEVRPAKSDDVQGVVPLMLAYCDFYEVPHPSESGLTEMAESLISLPDDQGFLHVAAEGSQASGAPGKVVGFAACGWKWSSLRGARIVVLEDLYIDPGFRGKGLADEMIRACAGTAREHGAPVMIWETQPTNKRAQAVYNRVGGVHETLLEYELEL